MYRWRLMDPAGERFKIVDVKDPRVEVAVPAYYIKRMKIESVRHQGVVNFHAHLEFPLLVVNGQFLGFSKVAVGVGRQLHQLPVIIPVSSRYLNRTRRLSYQESALLRVQRYPVGCPPRNYDEVALVKGEEPEYGLQGSLPFVDKVEL